MPRLDCFVSLVMCKNVLQIHWRTCLSKYPVEYHLMEVSVNAGRESGLLFVVDRVVKSKGLENSSFFL